MDAANTVIRVDFNKRPFLPAPARQEATSDYRLIEPLTARELSFLGCLAHGVSNKEIARDLNVSENTVKFHLKNVYSKLAVRTRTQAIKAAYELGVLSGMSEQKVPMTGSLA